MVESPLWALKMVRGFSGKLALCGKVREIDFGKQTPKNSTGRHT